MPTELHYLHIHKSSAARRSVPVNPRLHPPAASRLGQDIDHHLYSTCLFHPQRATKIRNLLRCNELQSSTPPKNVQKHAKTGVKLVKTGTKLAETGVKLVKTMRNLAKNSPRIPRFAFPLRITILPLLVLLARSSYGYRRACASPSSSSMFFVRLRELRVFVVTWFWLRLRRAVRLPVLRVFVVPSPSPAYNPSVL